MPPIFRLVAWWRHRQTLCSACHKNPKVVLAEGESRYCSEECGEWDGEMQSKASQPSTAGHAYLADKVSDALRWLSS